MTIMLPRDPEWWKTLTQSYQGDRFTMTGSNWRHVYILLRSHHGHSQDALMERPDSFSAPAAMELNVDSMDRYPEYRSVVHGTNHYRTVRIQAEQRLCTTTRVDNHFGERISGSRADESHVTGAHYQKA
eukprot:3443492-Karenia_brevis.AAC.1